MKLGIIAGLVVSSFTLSAISAANADEVVDETARGGLRHLKLNLADTLDDMQAAIAANTAGVEANAVAIGNNAAGISANSEASAQNAAAISANADAIAALQSQAPESFDYRDYGRADNVISKTYNIRNINTCDTETRNYSSVVNGDNTEITMTRIRTENGLPCGYHVFGFLKTPEARFRTSLNNYNKSGSRLNSTVTLDKPMVMRTSNMKIGQDLGDGTSTSFVDHNTPDISYPPGTFIQKTVLLGVDSVTVPLNGGTTFEGCLRYHMTHESTYGFGTGPIDRIEYHCPGLGMVKRIQANGAYYELSGVTYN